MREEDMPYRDAPKSEMFTISRKALNEAYSALAGAKAVLGDVANISLAMDQLKTANGDFGESYNGHEPNFVVSDASVQRSFYSEPKSD